MSFSSTSKRNDTGSALIMALLVVAMLGIILTAALPYARTSTVASSQAFTPARTARYDAESAIQAAIQYVKQNQQQGTTLGKDTGLPCPPSPGADPRDIFTYAGTSGPVTVDICPQVDSFDVDGSAHAVLLTLAGPNSGEGIDFSQNNTDLLRGDVWSNSYIHTGSSASVTVTLGSLWSWNTNSCGSVTALVGKFCSANATFGFSTLNGSVNNSQTTITVASNAKFPSSGQFVIEVENEQMLVTGGQGTNTWTVTRGYGGTTAAAHTSGKTVDFMPKTGLDPADPSLGHTADWQPAAAPGPVQTPSSCTLSPGVYKSGSALSAETSSCNSGMTLNPGVYYLDFPAGDTTWTINNTVTGACTAGQGAQLVFANQSQLAMGGGDLELCGRSISPSAPQIAMTYLSSSVGLGPNVNTTLRPTHAADGGGGFFPAVGATPASNAAYTGPADVTYPQDGTQARATIASNRKTANLQLDTFVPSSGPALTSSAALTSLVVKVAHDESQSNVNFTTTAPKLVWGTCNIPLTPAPTRQSGETLYVSADLSSSLSSCTFDPSSSPTLTWSVRTTSATSVNIDVDGAQIETTWHEPGVIGQNGCVTQLLSAGGCSLWSGPANGHDTMNITGVVYLPKNALSGTMKNGGSFNVSDALIARSINLDANPAAVGSPVIGGSNSIFTTGKVLFQAFIGGTEWTDAYATYDKTTFVPAINAWVDKK